MIDRNIFIVNPTAGKGKGNEVFIKEIRQVAEKMDLVTEHHRTTGVDDARKYVNRICEESDETMRFFACGGDGTLNEVFCGAYGHENAIVGCVPIGTGNDFVRNFEGDFCDIEAQLKADETNVDVLKYVGTLEGKVTEGCAANMFNIGFDCYVVKLIATMKQKIRYFGGFIYVIGVMMAFIKKKGANLQISIDGQVAYEGKLLLASIANGCFCGGGIMSNPLADIQDGTFDVQMIQDMKRITFLKLFPKYSKGKHIEDPYVQRKKIIKSNKAHNIKIIGLNGPFDISVDGEVKTFEEITINVDHKALRFAVPK